MLPPSRGDGRRSRRGAPGRLRRRIGRTAPGPLVRRVAWLFIACSVRRVYHLAMKNIAFIGVLCGAIALAAVPAMAQQVGERPFTPAQSDGGYNPPKPKKGFRYPDCFCTDSAGKRVELGKTTCLQIGSRQVLARCGMSLNNPTWRRISDGCPSV